MSLDFLSNLSQVIGQVSKDKGVSQSAVIDSVVQGVLSAVRKKYGTYRDIEVKYNKDTGELELFEFKKVVSDEEFEDELIEIKYSSAKELDPSAHIGDQVGTRLELKDLGRIDAQAAKQIIIQNLREIEHEIIFNEFEKRKGEITNGVVRRVDPGMIVVDLDKAEAYIPRKEQIPDEQYKSGERIQGYLLEVRQTTRGPQIIMSRAHEQYLIKLFEAEVPEVSEGIVKIVSAAREPGQRAKMSVYSTDPTVHPVGSCVGIKGSRIQNITQELKGERVDVIIWENDPVQYICNALAPAKISKILMDEEQKKMQIIVPDDQLSLAIGKKGQNVRLAVKLTGWNLNLISEQESKQAKKEALFNLSLVPEMSETKAQSLFQYGYTQVEQLAQAKAVDLKPIPELEDSAVAEKLIQSAKDLLKKYADEGNELPKLQDTKEEKKPLSSSLKEQAEEILKRELAQLEGGKTENQDQTAKAEENSIEEQTTTAKAEENSTEEQTTTAKAEENSIEEQTTTAKAEENSIEEQTTTAKAEENSIEEQTTTAKAEENSIEEQTTTAKAEENSIEEQTTTAKAEENSTEEQTTTAKAEENSIEEQTTTAKAEENSTEEQTTTAKAEENSIEEQTTTAKAEENSIEEQTTAKIEKDTAKKQNKEEVKA